MISSSRLYKSGDLAKYLPDGSLEFLGRADDQVKVRGFRIELGEIEAVLGEHPQVRETIVVAQHDVRGDKRLVAYVVPQSADTPPATADLHRQLHQRLPDYMVPSAFVFLDAFPLTANGKVDRKSLPAPDESRPDIETDYVAPRNRIEKSVAAIWCDLLGIEQVGIHDNFFALGGHSLLAATMHSRIASESQVDLPLRKLFEAPTVARLSREIEVMRNDGQSYSSEPLRRIDRNKLDRLPLSFAQERLWFLDQLEGRSATYNISWPVRLLGQLNVSALERSLQEIVRRHEACGRHAWLSTDVPQAVVRDPAAFRLTVTDLQSVPEADRESAGSETGVRGSRPTIRPGAGPDAAGSALAVGRSRAGADPDDAPHRLRRLVNGSVRPRAVGVVRSICPGSTFAAARVAYPVPGLRGLAAEVVARRRAGPATGVLERTTGGCSRNAGATDRLSAATGGELSRCTARVRVGRQADAGLAHAEPTGGGDSVHAAAGGVAGAALAVQRAGRCSRWDRRSRDETGRNWRG